MSMTIKCHFKDETWELLDHEVVLEEGMTMILKPDNISVEVANIETVMFREGDNADIVQHIYLDGQE